MIRFAAVAAKGTGGAARRGVRWVVAAAVLLAGLVAANAATGHIERASYWPDPAPDTSVTWRSGTISTPSRSANQR